MLHAMMNKIFSINMGVTGLEISHIPNSFKQKFQSPNLSDNMNTNDVLWYIIDVLWYIIVIFLYFQHVE